ncbi:Protein of uncharacterised function (DUF3013) [Streptococcus pneumoniae]|nr:Protein of uncharacterised function (DUF3013) [Streptococcus pneumoniae]
MATYGFLDILEEELDKNFPFDFEISWDKRNHAVEVSFLKSLISSFLIKINIKSPRKG